MRLKLIACKAISREMCFLCAKSPHTIDITFLRQGIHSTPDLLRKVLQDEINSVEGGNDYRTNDIKLNSPYMREGFDAILLGYGLCSNVIAGIYSDKYSLVIPRAHDCISFLLGSKEKYAKCFAEMPGTYWYTMSWIECGAASGDNNAEAEAQHYRNKGYDEEEIEFLMESSRSWIRNYNTAAYIKMPFFDKEEYREYTKKIAGSYGWEYREMDGDMALMEDFVSGKWDEGRFLVVPPGNKITASYDDKIIGFTKI